MAARVFVTASADHRHDGHSTYPFAIFGGGMPEGAPLPAGSGPRHGDRP